MSANKTDIIDWDKMPDALTFRIKSIGFVYKITELDTGKFYYGIKKIITEKKLNPLKGKKNKRIKQVETDWATYNTSSKLMQEKLKNNRNNYHKEILRFCGSVTEMKVYEAYYQLHEFIHGKWDNCYNEMINLRLRIRK